jgi:hypothetical protein
VSAPARPAARPHAPVRYAIAHPADSMQAVRTVSAVAAYRPAPIAAAAWRPAHSSWSAPRPAAAAPATVSALGSSLGYSHPALPAPVPVSDGG